MRVKLRRASIEAVELVLADKLDFLASLDKVRVLNVDLIANVLRDLAGLASGIGETTNSDEAILTPRVIRTRRLVLAEVEGTFRLRRFLLAAVLVLPSLRPGAVVEVELLNVGAGLWKRLEGLYDGRVITVHGGLVVVRVEAIGGL
jgi:hypothetical protein